MFKDREKLYQAYQTILSIVLTWALVLEINQYYELRVSFILSLFYSFVPALLIYLFDINRKNTVRYFLFGSLIPLIVLIFWIKKINPIHWSKELIEWCNTYNGSDELYVGYHANFVVFGIACLGAFLFYLLMKRQTAKIALAVILLATMIILSISKEDGNKVVVGIFIFYILTIIVELYGIIYSRKAGKQEKKEGILYLAPICLLLAVLSIAIPSKPEPIQWEGVKSAYHNVKEQIEVWKTELDYYFGNSESEFFISLTGYSEDSGELSNNGGVTKDNKVALRVSGSQGNKPTYLIGSVSDVYTGSSWEKSQLTYLTGETEHLLDYTELIYALSKQGLDKLHNNRFVEQKVIEIEYNNIKTKTFFYPSKMRWYKLLSNKDKVLADPANITFLKVRGKGTTYQNVSFAMNLQGEAFQQMLREADNFSYGNAESINLEAAKYVQSGVGYRENTDNLFSRWNFYEILGDRAELIKTQYTGLPVTLPDRVKELAEKITADYDTTYDKLKAIEAYLREYEYTLNPKQVPSSEDFTDYFLFENKQGYCTSYATAMAILGRCIGVPTRYVEGFVVTYDNKDNKNMFPVKNSQAHAWAEAYFEGVGWIPFEATAPFYNVRYTKWAEITKREETAPDYSFQYEQYMQQVQKPYQIGEITKIEKDDNNYMEVVNIIAVVVATILLLLISLIIYDYILKYRYSKMFRKADNSDKMYILFLRILKLLKREGFVLDQQETILMLSRRVKDHFHYDRVTFQQVVSIFMRYRYAEEEITKEEYEKVAIFHLGMANKQREEQPKVRVWLEEFIFLAKKNYL